MINAHREGEILVPAVRSGIAAKRACIEEGISAEVVLVCDSADEATTVVATRLARQIDKVIDVDYQNLGASRTHGIRNSFGNYICFLDGDDVMQPDWPRRAYRYQRDNLNQNVILHTEVFAGFGDDVFARIQIGTRDPLFRKLDLSNTWIFCNNLFASRTILESNEIIPYDHAAGYGSEDWHWSTITTARGIERCVVPHTVYFYRVNKRKPSLGAQKGLSLRPTQLFSDRDVLQNSINDSGMPRIQTAEDVRLAHSLRRSRLPDRWLVDEAKKATAFDHDIYSLMKRLRTISMETPRLYRPVTVLFAEIALFILEKRYIIVGLDCENASDHWLAPIVSSITSLSSISTMIVFCGNRLTNKQLIAKSENILYVNYKMVLEELNYDPYSLNNALSNLLSNHSNCAIVNINSEFIDIATGQYQRTINTMKIKAARVLFQAVEDVMVASNDRRILSNQNEMSVAYSELWVGTSDSANYLRTLYEAYGTSIRSADSPHPDEIVRAAIAAGFDSDPTAKGSEKQKIMSTLKKVRTHPNIDVTCVLNLHREGGMLAPTLKSIVRMLAEAARHGIRPQLIMVFDDADAHTIQVATFYSEQLRAFATVSPTKVLHRNLARARRAGLELASGNHIAFLDADDLYSKNWIAAAHQTVTQLGTEAICHPAISVYFGEQQRLWWHYDERVHKVPYAGLLLQNYWTSLSYAPISVYKNNIIGDIDLENGFGYEDWQWNMQTIAAGIPHTVAPETTHFIRLKPSGSLNSASGKANALTRPSGFLAHIANNEDNDGP